MQVALLCIVLPDSGVKLAKSMPALRQVWRFAMAVPLSTQAALLASSPLAILRKRSRLCQLWHRHCTSDEFHRTATSQYNTSTLQERQQTFFLPSLQC